MRNLGEIVKCRSIKGVVIHNRQTLINYGKNVWDAYYFLLKVNKKLIIDNILSEINKNIENR